MATLRSVAAPDLLDEPLEIGRRIAAAIGYAKGKKTREVIAREIGVSPPTLLSYTKGSLGDFSKSKDERRRLIELVEQVTECPPELFGLSEPEPKAADQLREEMRAMKVELLGEIEKVRRAQASRPASSAPSAEG